MLKKLKIKFVAINMCLVGIVLLIVFAVLCVGTYERGKEEVDRTLEIALSDTFEELSAPKEIGAPPEEMGLLAERKEIPDNEEKGETGEMPKGFDAKPMNYTAVVVLLDDDGEGYEIVEQRRGDAVINDASMNEKTLEEAAKAARRAEKQKGKLSELGLFYMKRETGDGTKAAFVDSAYFDATIKESLFNSLLLFALGMAGLLLISIMLAGMAVRPVKKAWDQQKRFIADASHELNTPLTVILANNEILLSDVSDPLSDRTEVRKERRKWIESSQEEALHMKRLVDDLLFLARSDEDVEGRSLIKSRMDLSELVTDVALQLEPVVFEAQLSMEMHIQEKVFFECDGERMKKLAYILLDNAVKYAAGERKIWLGLEKSGNKIRLLAANTGDIIAEEELEHLFDRFYRSDQARTGKDGYGLGLSIAKTIVEEHGGALKVRSGDLSVMELPVKWQTPEGVKGTLMEAQF